MLACSHDSTDTRTSARNQNFSRNRLAFTVCTQRVHEEKSRQYCDTAFLTASTPSIPGTVEEDVDAGDVPGEVLDVLLNRDVQPSHGDRQLLSSRFLGQLLQ